VLLLGMMSGNFPQREVYFALGAACASFIFFFALGYGAGFLRPFFARPRVWRIFEGIITGLMWFLGVKLLL
jgi:L-lysine exporter family protein LysE/ArgO